MHGAPDTVSLLPAHTPPPLLLPEVLPEMVPPVMVHAALRMTYTPPPYSAAVLPEMVPPDMLKT